MPNILHRVGIAAEPALVFEPLTTVDEKAIKALPIPAIGNKVHFFTGATLQGITAPGSASPLAAPGHSQLPTSWRVAPDHDRQMANMDSSAGGEGNA
jgi:hypothetical protein